MTNLCSSKSNIKSFICIAVLITSLTLIMSYIGTKNVNTYIVVAPISYGLAGITIGYTIGRMVVPTKIEYKYIERESLIA